MRDTEVLAVKDKVVDAEVVTVVVKVDDGDDISQPSNPPEINTEVAHTNHINQNQPPPIIQLSLPSR